MNRARAKELLPIIEAFANGEEIQARYKGSDSWMGVDETTFIDDNEYRIKPKPREWILEMNTDGTVRNVLERDEAPWFDGAVHVLVREVV